MSHPATAVYVMIASPADVPEAREAVHRAISRWNESNTRTRNIALIPLRWETSAVPMLGDSPQAIINAQLVDSADIVIALFGSRLGTVTSEAASGTAEEIERAEGAGKPIHLYFSTAPHPNDVEPEQLLALQNFRAELEKRGLYGTFNSAEELSAHVWQAIDHDLHGLELTAPSEPNTTCGVRFFAQPGMERYADIDSKGRTRYRTRRWVELTNRGDVDAQEVTFSASEGVFLGNTGPTVVHSEQTRRIPMELMMGAPQDVIFTVHWVEDEPRTEEFHVG